MAQQTARSPHQAAKRTRLTVVSVEPEAGLLTGDDDLGWPRMIVFVIPLKDHFPLPSESTSLRTYEDNPLPGLADVEMRRTADDPPYPQELAGKRFVSLRFWQVPGEVSSETTEMIRAAHTVLQAVADVPIPNQASRPLTPWQEYRTVVEAVTPVWDEDDIYETNEKPDPLTRCISALIEQIRAYRVGLSASIPELTYERIFPFVMFMWRELATNRYGDGPSLMMLSHTNLPFGPPEIIRAEEYERYRQALGRLLNGDPLFLFSERRLNASIALYGNGDFSESCVQSATAAEVLLDSLLGMLLWEGGLESDDAGTDVAVQELSLNLVRKVRQCFHARLGDVWRREGPGPVPAWFSRTAQVRNRVVHRGYRPTRKEAEESFAAVNELMTFICDRLAEKRRRYPRTTLRFLGRDGLDRRNAWSEAIFGDDVIGWVESYTRDYVHWRDQVDARIEKSRLAE